MKVNLEVGNLTQLDNQKIVTEYIGSVILRGGMTVREEDAEGREIREWSGQLLDTFKKAIERWDLLERNDVIWIRYPLLAINALQFKHNEELVYLPLRSEISGFVDRLYDETEFTQLSHAALISRLRGAEEEEHWYGDEAKMRAAIRAGERAYLNEEEPQNRS